MATKGKATTTGSAKRTATAKKRQTIAKRHVGRRGGKSFRTVNAPKSW